MSNSENGGYIAPMEQLWPESRLAPHKTLIGGMMEMSEKLRELQLKLTNKAARESPARVETAEGFSAGFDACFAAMVPLIEALEWIDRYCAEHLHEMEGQAPIHIKAREALKEIGYD